MAKFRFSLEKLLQIKKFKEDQKAIELAVAQAKLNRILQDKSNLTDKKGVYFTLPMKAEINLQQLRAGNDYLLQINRQIKMAEKNITMAEKKVEEKRLLLTHANQEKRSVELLREKHLLAFKKAENQTSMKNENEVALRMLRDNGNNPV
ncbi:MAG: flagellar export protein FliJ [Calditrichae bacterium]|nr:flagellar export protein FliJ [Calditrichota bacterium]MCB9059242.1 flagellar export protein FliJ [Calditrichia bacterium]